MTLWRPTGQVSPLLLIKGTFGQLGQLLVARSILHLGINSAFGKYTLTNEFLSSGAGWGGGGTNK